jgi:hypothetical protein
MAGPFSAANRIRIAMVPVVHRLRLAQFPADREDAHALSRLDRSNRLCGRGADDLAGSADGHLMPTRKNQPPPDLRYFKQTQK